MWGVIPFLVQWAALTYFVTKPQDYSYGHFPITNEPKYQQPAPSIGHYTLLSEFESLQEEEIESFLPQIMNIILDRDALSDPHVIDHLEKIIIRKCSKCFPFGLRVFGALRAAAERPSEGFLRSFLNNSPTDQRKQENLRRFRGEVEKATREGGDDVTEMTRMLRSKYFSDFHSLLDWLGDLGVQMKAYPREQRDMRLKDALAKGNRLLYYRMLSQESIADSTTSFEEMNDFQSITEKEIAELCPALASFSLHLPLQHSKEKVLRILRFVHEECETLPSKDRCPYLVVVELLERDFQCKEDRLFTEGHKRLLTAADIARGLHYDDDDEPAMETYRIRREGDEEDGKSLPGSEELNSNGLQIPPTSTEQQPRQQFNPHHQVDSPNENVRLFARPDIPVSPLSSSSSSSRSTSASTIEGLRGGGTADYFPLQEQPQYPHYPSRHPAESHPKVSQPQQLQQCDLPPPFPHPHDDPCSQPYFQQQQVVPIHHHNHRAYTVAAPVRPQTWEQKKRMIKAESPFGQLKDWTLRSFIVKSGDDLRKEVLAMQLIEQCQKIFQTAGLDIYLRPYQILPTGQQSGLVEFLEGALSIDRIKKLKPDRSMSLSDYFSLFFGDSYNFMYARGVQNFVKSLVGYSLFTYLAQVKDRHNANLLIDQEGHIVHIDFGFILGDSPGFNMNYESAPFKLPKEYVDLMGGLDSQTFAMFQDLFIRGFYALQKHVEELATIVHLFYGDRRRGDAIRSRLLFPTSHEDILGLVRDSYDNARTKSYDWFQHQTNNISK